MVVRGTQGTYASAAGRYIADLAVEVVRLE